MNDKDTVVVPPRARIAKLLADEVRDYRAAQDAAATERDKLYRMGQKDALILVGPLIDEVLAAAPSTSVREEVENERLRTALEQILALNQVRHWTATDNNPQSHWVRSDGQYAAIARAALKPSTDKGGAE